MTVDTESKYNFVIFSAFAKRAIKRQKLWYPNFMM